MRLLDAGIRVPPVVTGCHSYLIKNIEMLHILIASGMNPDLPACSGETFLHDLCSGSKRGQTPADAIERARILLDAGARSPPETRSTVRHRSHGRPERTCRKWWNFLLGHGAPTNLPDDAPWATPLAWAERRGTRRGRRGPCGSLAPPGKPNRPFGIRCSAVIACRSILPGEKNVRCLPQHRLRVA